MRMVTFKVPEAYVEAIDTLVKKGFFTNRSEAIRYAVRRLIEQYRMYLVEESEPEQHEAEDVEYRPAEYYSNSYEEEEELEIGF